MKLSPYLFNKDFTGQIMQPDVQWRINQMAWDSLGGCSEANITAYGASTNLWELAEMLRCPIEIHDDTGQACWWGYVSEVRMRVGALEIGATLENMYNAVAVTYSYVAPGTATVGTRKTTPWAEDAASVTQYGRREFLSSQGGQTDASAIARRNAILRSRAWPQALATPFGMPKGMIQNSQNSATIICKGWMDTLKWRYAQVNSTVSRDAAIQIQNLVLWQSDFVLGGVQPDYTGVDSSEYRKGDKTVYDEIVDLMKAGGMGGGQLIAEVGQNRFLYIREEGSVYYGINYTMDREGRLSTVMGAPVEEWRPPVGVWCKLVGVVPDSADVSQMINPAIQFIEGATWSPDTGLIPRFRGQPNINDMLKVLR